jgi:hypothetical protein
MDSKPDIKVFKVDTTNPVGQMTELPSIKVIYAFKFALAVAAGLFILLTICLVMYGDVNTALLSALTGVIGTFFGLIGGSKL